MENPYEPHPTSRFEARPRAPQRRGADYHLPPIGSGHHLDRRHLIRQERIGRLIIGVVLLAPIAYWIGWECGWW